jgi:hypothetical protein
MKPRVNRLQEPRIPLMWECKGRLRHIGYWFPNSNSLVTAKGNPSLKQRMNPRGKVLVNKNKMHDRRMFAAYEAEDYIYHGD